jgi:pterin-4a-carbinolamine dehydratase
VDVLTSLERERGMAMAKRRKAGPDRRDGTPAARDPESDVFRRRLGAAEAAAEMADLPDWRLAADRRSLGCSIRFSAYPLAVMFLNLVTGLAELTATYPDISVRGTRVSLRLVAPRGGGLTGAHFAFAHALQGTIGLSRAVMARRAAARPAAAKRT